MSEKKLTIAATLNAWDDELARVQLLRCCGSTNWVAAMMAKRPFDTDESVFQSAEQTWWNLKPNDWLEAFAAHPRIGDRNSLREKFGSTADLCRQEQAGVAGADVNVFQSLADANDEYQNRFGYIFIVCATGKTASEMLTILRGRLKNAPTDEIRIAAAEQAKITQLRMEKL